MSAQNQIHTKYRRVVSLFLVFSFILSDISFAAQDAGDFALAPPLVFKPLCEIIQRTDGQFDVLTFEDAAKSADAVTLMASNGNPFEYAFQSRWVFIHISLLLGQMLKITAEHDIENPKNILVPLIEKHLEACQGTHLSVIEGYDIKNIEELRQNGKVTGFVLPLSKDGVITRRFVYDMKSGSNVIKVDDAPVVYVDVELSPPDGFIPESLPRGRRDEVAALIRARKYAQAAHYIWQSARQGHKIERDLASRVFKATLLGSLSEKGGMLALERAWVKGKFEQLPAEEAVADILGQGDVAGPGVTRVITDHIKLFSHRNIDLSPAVGEALFRHLLRIKPAEAAVYKEFSYRGLIGAGAIGFVFEVTDKAGRQYALKISGASYYERMKELKEKISGFPDAVKIIDVDLVGNHCCFVEEILEGEEFSLTNVRETLLSKKVTGLERLDVLAELGTALNRLTALDILPADCQFFVSGAGSKVRVSFFDMDSWRSFGSVPETWQSALKRDIIGFYLNMISIALDETAVKGFDAGKLRGLLEKLNTVSGSLRNEKGRDVGIIKALLLLKGVVHSLLGEKEAAVRDIAAAREDLFKAYPPDMLKEMLGSNYGTVMCPDSFPALRPFEERVLGLIDSGNYSKAIRLLKENEEKGNRASRNVAAAVFRGVFLGRLRLHSGLTDKEKSDVSGIFAGAASPEDAVREVFYSFPNKEAKALLIHTILKFTNHKIDFPPYFYEVLFRDYCGLGAASPAVFGPYRYERLIGGNIGTVFEVTDERDGRKYAFKALKADGEKYYHRYERLKNALGSDPDMVDIVDIGRIDGGCYVVMELAPGILIKALDPLAKIETVSLSPLERLAILIEFDRVVNGLVNSGIIPIDSQFFATGTGPDMAIKMCDFDFWTFKGSLEYGDIPSFEAEMLIFHAATIRDLLKYFARGDADRAFAGKMLKKIDAQLEGARTPAERGSSLLKYLYLTRGVIKLVLREDGAADQDIAAAGEQLLQVFEERNLRARFGDMYDVIFRQASGNGEGRARPPIVPAAMARRAENFTGNYFYAGEMVFSNLGTGEKFGLVKKGVEYRLVLNGRSVDDSEIIFSETDEEVILQSIYLGDTDAGYDNTGKGYGRTVIQFLADYAKSREKDLRIKNTANYGLMKMCHGYISEGARYITTDGAAHEFSGTWLRDKGPVSVSFGKEQNEAELFYKAGDGSRDFEFLPGEAEAPAAKRDQDLASRVRVYSSGDRVFVEWLGAAEHPLRYQISLGKMRCDIKIDKENISRLVIPLKPARISLSQGLVVKATKVAMPFQKDVIGEIRTANLKENTVNADTIRLRNIETGEFFALNKWVFEGEKKDGFYGVTVDGTSVPSGGEISFKENDKEIVLSSIYLASMEYDNTGRGIGRTIAQYLADNAKARNKDFRIETTSNYGLMRMCHRYISRGTFFSNSGGTRSFSGSMLKEFSPIRLLFRYHGKPSEQLTYIENEEGTDMEFVGHTNPESDLYTKIRVLRTGDDVIVKWLDGKGAGKDDLRPQVYIQYIGDIRIAKEDIPELAVTIGPREADTLKYAVSTAKRHAANLADTVKYIEAEKAAGPVVVALGTGWIKGYEKGAGRQYGALNPLITSIRSYCFSRGIAFVAGDDESLLGLINAERVRLNAPGARVIVLAGESTVKSEEYSALRKDRAGACVIGVNNKELTDDSFIRVVEMVNLALRLAFRTDMNPLSVNIGIARDDAFDGIYIFTPRAEPMPYEELKQLYQAQKFA